MAGRGIDWFLAPKARGAGLAVRLHMGSDSNGVTLREESDLVGGSGAEGIRCAIVACAQQSMLSVQGAPMSDRLNEAKSTPDGTCDDRNCHRTAFGAVMEIARTHDGSASVLGRTFTRSLQHQLAPTFHYQCAFE